MSKIEYAKLPPEERLALSEELRASLLHLPQKSDIVGFLFDFLTQSEQVMLARRIRIAKHLLSGKTHHEIRAELRVGFDTIRLVHGWLEEKFTNYRAILPPLLEEQKGKSKTSGKHRYRIPLDPNSFRGLRKRYPAHFLLLNLLLGDPDVYEEC